MEQIDFNLLKLIQSGFHSQAMDLVLPLIRNKWTWIPLYIVLLIYLYRRYTFKTFLLIVISTLILVGLSDVLCAFILKPLFHRVRPCELYKNTMELINYGLCSHTFSFPSCHATNHMALASYLSYYVHKKWIKIALYLWVGAICFAQLYVGVHYPSDIIGGVILGYGLAKLMRLVVLNQNFNRLNVRL